MALTDTLAYYDKQLMTGVKKFFVQDPLACVVKLFMQPDVMLWRDKLGRLTILLLTILNLSMIMSLGVRHIRF
jgi:hypothetical protein